RLRALETRRGPAPLLTRGTRMIRGNTRGPALRRGPVGRSGQASVPSGPAVPRLRLRYRAAPPAPTATTAAATRPSTAVPVRGSEPPLPSPGLGLWLAGA